MILTAHTCTTLIRVIWLNSGFLGLGALAAGVRDPSRSFPLLVVSLCPFVFLVNTAPFFVSLCISDDRTMYDAGYFSVRVLTLFASQNSGSAQNDDELFSELHVPPTFA